MKTKPLTHRGFTNLVNQLKTWVAELAAIVDHEYPPGTVYDPQSYPAGSGWSGPTYLIRKRIEEVIEAFSILQEALGLPPGELSMPRHLEADRAAAREAWPTMGSVRAEMVESMAAIVHDEKASPRARQMAARLILDASHQDRMARLLEESNQFYRSLSRRLDVLERKAAERLQAEAGETRAPEKEDPPMAEKKTTAKSRNQAKAAPATKKPSAVDGKGKPMSKGGAGRPTRHC